MSAYRTTRYYRSSWQVQAFVDGHPKESTTFRGSGGMGDAPMEQSGTEPALDSRRHVGSLDAAAAVRLPQRPSAP